MMGNNYFFKKLTSNLHQTYTEQKERYACNYTVVARNEEFQFM